MTPELIMTAIVAVLVGFIMGRVSGRAAEAREQGPRAMPRPVRRAAPKMRSADLGEDDLGPVLDAMYAQKKIMAIKIYREMTGAGLKESKDFVEDLARRHGIN